MSWQYRYCSKLLCTSEVHFLMTSMKMTSLQSLTSTGHLFQGQSPSRRRTLVGSNRGMTRSPGSSPAGMAGMVVWPACGGSKLTVSTVSALTCWTPSFLSCSVNFSAYCLMKSSYISILSRSLAPFLFVSYQSQTLLLKVKMRMQCFQICLPNASFRLFMMSGLPSANLQDGSTDMQYTRRSTPPVLVCSASFFSSSFFPLCCRPLVSVTYKVTLFFSLVSVVHSVVTGSGDNLISFSRPKSLLATCDFPAPCFPARTTCYLFHCGNHLRFEIRW